MSRGSSPSTPSSPSDYAAYLWEDDTGDYFARETDGYTHLDYDHSAWRWLGELIPERPDGIEPYLLPESVSEV